MSTIGNNISGEKSHVRDSFFDSKEEQYFKKLLSDPKERRLHSKLLKENVDKLYAKACNLIDRVEQGEFTEEEMVNVERAIAHCLAAIEDCEKVLEKELDLCL